MISHFFPSTSSITNSLWASYMNRQEQLRYEQQCFESDGFRTGEIILPGLHIPIQLNPHQYFRYDGLVDSIPEYVASLPIDIRLILQQAPGWSRAYNHDFIFGSTTGFIMVVENISPRVNAHNVAHEAAEIAHSFGRNDLLEQYLASHGYTVNLNGLSKHQVGVVLGYTQALLEGFNISDLYEELDPAGWQLLKKLGFI